MNSFKSLVITLSMFTKIPMPAVEWKKENMRFIFCWFPLIGAILGILECIWYIVADRFDLGCFIYAAVATVIPVVLTGGIHIDGFMDTCDALCSHGDKEKIRQILADPHTGAFAVIYTIVYFIIYFGAFTQLYGSGKAVMCLCCSYVFVRAMAVVFIMSTRFSKNEGLLYSLTEHNSAVVTSIITVVWVMGSLSAMEFAYIVPALTATVFIILFTLIFKKIVIKKFDGISGDIAGFFIAKAELLCIVAIVAGSVII